MKQFLIHFVLIFSTIVAMAQIPVGQWREHLPYNSAISLADDGTDRIYCATPFSIFYYTKSDNSITKLSSVNKLSDIGVSCIAFDQKLQTLIIGYENGNIDLMKNDIVSNLADIKRKAMIGSKKINHILLFDSKAYLSTDFGIVVLDFEKKEINDTYFIGPNAQSLRINRLEIFDTLFVAATESGIYSASINNPNLANFQNWTKDLSIPNPSSDFTCLTTYGDQLLTAYKGATYASDTIYAFSNGLWKKSFHHLNGPFKVLKGIGDTLIIASEFGFTYYFNNLTDSFVAFDYNQPGFSQIMPQPHDIIIDKKGSIWIADESYALVNNPLPWSYSFILPSGPRYKSGWDMSIENQKLWVASGGYQTTGVPNYNRQGVYEFFDNEWSSLNYFNTDFFDTISDVVSVAVNPANNNEVYFGTWGAGLLKINNGKLTKIFNQSNSTLKEASNWPGFIGISDLHYDIEGNLWVANTAHPQGLSKLSPNGTWQSFSLAPYLSEDMTGQITIDDLNQKWIVLQRGRGIIVYNDNFTPENQSDDRKTLLTSATGSGGLPSSTVYSIAKDLDGEIWVGTAAGVAVFYSPELIFSGYEYDAQQIYIDQQGISQYLLESEEVTAIAIDGANRKWFGTRNSGVFLMSADGTEQIQHFNIDNSPILSNNIFSIAIDHISGEVFFGTEKGIISYRSDATIGQENHDSVKIFPNPVRPNYNGLITISGLVDFANVKITDIAGNLVFEAEANGGSIVWDGTNLQGNRPATGVYLVFSTNNDGTEKIVSKILFIK